MPPVRARLGGLDGLRAVAAGLVFLCHAGLLWANHRDQTDGFLQVAGSAQGQLGTFGVAIFFVVSGCVIFRPFVDAVASFDLAAYARRRVARIVPAYWVALAMFALVLPDRVPGLRTTDVWAFAGFLQIYAPGLASHGLQPAWTLCIEVTFYVAVPVFALARGRDGALLLAGFAGASVLVQALHPHAVAASTLLGYGDWFAIGMGLAWLSCGHGERLIAAAARQRNAIWVVAAIGFLATASLGDRFVEHVGFGILAGLVVLPALGSGRGRAAGWMGDRSYGIYLWHYPLLGWLAMTMPNAATFLLAGVGLTLMAASLSYALVERPSMNWARALPGHGPMNASARLERGTPQPEAR